LITPRTITVGQYANGNPIELTVDTRDVLAAMFARMDKEKTK